jgi:TRAP-type mannitol/chloroaromatic compound transport system permease small subunit
MPVSSVKAAWGLGRIEKRPGPAILRSPAIVSAVAKIVDAVNALSIFAGVLAGLGLFAISGLMAAEIIGRNLGHSLPYGWEYSAYLMSASFFLAGGFTLLSAGHVRVMFLVSDPQARRSYILELAGTAVTIAILGVVAWALSDLALQYGRSGTISYTQAATPMVVPTTAVAVGAIILLCQSIARLLGLLIGRQDVFVFSQTDILEG